MIKANEMQRSFLKKFCSAGLIMAVTAAGCKKIPEGFLSDGIYVADSPIQLERGNPFQKSSSLSLDGTTRPATVKLLDIRRVGSTQRAEEFFKKYPVYVYKAAIDPEKDTTIALVNAKRELKTLEPFQFLSSGQFVFNGATDSLPLDVTYEYDVEVTNVAGVKTFRKIGLIHTIDPERAKVTSSGGNSWFEDFTTKSGTLGNLRINITILADTGHIAILKITDKDGKAFNPKTGEIIKRGDRPTFESYARFHPVTFTDTTMSCDYEITPFPGRALPGYGGFLMYYRIPSKYVNIDPSVGAPAASSANPRFGFQIKKAGTYLIEVQMEKVTKKTS